MNERTAARPRRMAVPDRQVLAAAYLPVIGLAVAVIAAGFSPPRGYQIPGSLV